MIEYIDGQLKKWALWQAVRDDMGLGHVQSQLGKLGASRGKAFSGIPLGVSDDDMQELTGIIGWLPEGFRVAVWECYLMPGTPEQHWEACGCSKATYFRRLHEAHTLVMEALQVGRENVEQLSASYACIKEELHRVGGLTTRAARVVQNNKFFQKGVDMVA